MKFTRAGTLVLIGLLYWLLSPAGINGDGIGYLNQLQLDVLAPGHPGYLPLLRLVAAHYPHQTLIELAPALRLLSVFCAVLALGLFHDSCRRVAHAPGAMLATALLGGSHAFWRSATEIEAYAPAVLCTTATLWALIRLREALASEEHLWRREPYAVLAGLMGGLAVSFHLTLGLLALPVGLELLRGRRWRCTLWGLGALGLAIALPLWWALSQQAPTGPAAAWNWLLAADHGMPYRHSMLTPLKGLWGLCRSLVHAPYPYEASMPGVVVLTVVGAICWSVLCYVRWHPPRPLKLRSWAPDRWLLTAWIVPLSLFALYFYPSDSERWIFVLPPLLLWLAPALGHRLADGRRGPTTTVTRLVVLCNVASFQLPLALDRSGVERAALVDRLAAPGDLVISPGHGWDELVGLGTRRPAQRFPLVYHAGTSGLGPALVEMHRRIQRTLTSGSRVWAARLRDKEDRRGFKELQWFGLRPQDFVDQLLRYEVRPAPMMGVWEIRLSSSAPR